jgi:hypothetical protein
MYTGATGGSSVLGADRMGLTNSRARNYGLSIIVIATEQWFKRCRFFTLPDNRKFLGPNNDLACVSAAYLSEFEEP